MSLYWRDLEIVPGMLLDVELYHHEVYDDEGRPASLRWRILSFGSRTGEDAYLEYSTGKKYPMKKVIKKRRLQARLERGELLQLPAGSDFMVVQEYHNGIEVFKRCYNLDLLATVRNIRAV